MGIKFFCPNGHKLNVKSFLGGKKAICPKCGVKVIVPLAGAGGVAQSGGPAGSPSPDAPLSTGLGQQSLESPPVVDPAAGPPAQSEFSADSKAMNDPIDEAPNAVWYVRPPSGGQFGPAAGLTMRAWIQEGRVSANSLVWRDGWPEWRAAASVFPALAGWHGAGGPVAAPAVMAAPGWPAPGAMGAPGAAPMVPGGYAPAATPLANVAAALESPFSGLEEAAMALDSAPRRRRQKKGPDLTLYVSGALVVMTVMLVVILAIVVLRQQDEPGGSEPAKPAPAAKSHHSKAGAKKSVDPAEKAIADPPADEPAEGKMEEK